MKLLNHEKYLKLLKFTRNIRDGMRHKNVNKIFKTSENVYIFLK
jgi:hypothetical protein